MSKKDTSGSSPSRRRKSPSRRRPRGGPGSFGDLCEISGGLAVVWRRNGCTEREMWAFAEDDPSILCDACLRGGLR